MLAAANIAPVALDTGRNAGCGHRTAPGNMTSLAIYPENMGKPRGGRSWWKEGILRYLVKEGNAIAGEDVGVYEAICDQAILSTTPSQALNTTWRGFQ